MQTMITKRLTLAVLAAACTLCHADSATVFFNNSAGSACGTCQAEDPILTIEVGRHTGSITGMAASPDGRTLATIAEDKSIRIWDVESGRPARALRLFTRSEDSPVGRLTGIDFSPDGKTIAVTGGSLRGMVGGGTDVHFIDVKTATVTRVLPGTAADSVRFLPDGRSVVIGFGTLGPNGGLAVIDVASGMGKRLEGESFYPNQIGLLSGGGFLVAGHDGYLRLYTKDLVLAARTKVATIPRRLAVAPDERQVAVAGKGPDAPVYIFDARTLALQKTVRQADLGADSVSTLAWDPTGRYLYMGASPSGQRADVVRRWDATSERSADLEVGDDAVSGLVPLASGRLIYSLANRWGLYDYAKGAFLYRPGSNSLDFRERELALSDDASTVSIGAGASSLAFSIKDRRLLDASEQAALKLSLPVHQSAHFEISHWRSDYLKLDGVAVGRFSRAMSVIESAGAFLVGGNRELLRYDKDGLAQWTTVQGSIAWQVNSDRQGRYAVAALGDGSLRWFDLGSGKQVLGLFIHSDRKRWVMWTPEGYYDTSPGAEDLVGWHVNQAGDREARFVPNGQLYDVFYRPDIVQARFRGEDTKDLITLTAAQALKSPPPRVSFVTLPRNAATAKERVCYRIVSAGGGIGEVRLFQNGKLIKSDGFYREAVARRQEAMQLASNTGARLYGDLRGLKRLNDGTAGLAVNERNKGQTFDECVDFDALPGDNELGLVAFNAQNSVQSPIETASFNSSRQPVTPKLYVLAVGIDKFVRQSVNLQFAAKDARDFGAMLSAKAATLVDPTGIEVVQLLDRAAGKSGITGAITRLAEKVKPWDTFVLFVASHGLMQSSQYYLVTSDYDGTASPDNLISANEIVELSKKIPALKQLFVFDTCHAGGVDNIMSGIYDSRMSVLAKKMGLHVYASAGSLQQALDGYQGNGLFTHTLLKSMQEAGATDTNGDRLVSVVELGKSASERTGQISRKIGHAQAPVIIHFGRDVPLFGVP